MNSIFAKILILFSDATLKFILAISRFIGHNAVSRKQYNKYMIN